MTFILYDGNYYEEHVKNARTTAKRKKMAASNATFKEYEFNIDIGNSFDEGKLDSLSNKGYPMMYSLKEIKDTIPKLKETYYESLDLRAKNITNTLTLVPVGMHVGFKGSRHVLLY